MMIKEIFVKVKIYRLRSRIDNRGVLTYVFDENINDFKQKETRIYSMPKEGTFFGIHYREECDPMTKFVTVIKGRAAVWRKQGSNSAKTMIVSQRHPRDPMHRCPKRRHLFGSLKLQKESIKGNKRKIKGKSILLKKEKARKQRIYVACEPRGMVRQTGLECLNTVFQTICRIDEMSILRHFRRKYNN